MENTENNQIALELHNTVIPITSDQLMPTTSFREHSKRGKELIQLKVDQIVVRPGHNARTIFDPEYIQELAESIAAIGLEEPLTVDFLKDGTAYLTKGECRLRAIKRLINLSTPENQYAEKFEYVQCFVNPKNATEKSRTISMLVENMKMPLSPMEEAEGLMRLKNEGMSNADINRALPRMNMMTIGNRLSLAGLTEEEKGLIEDGKISPTAAVKLSRIESDPEKRVQAIEDAAAGEDGKLKVKSLGETGEENEEDFTEQNTDKENELDENGDPRSSETFKDLREEYDRTHSGSDDDKSMKGTSPKAPPENKQDPAIKSVDQPSTDDSFVTSGKATAFDMLTEISLMFKGLENEVGDDASSKAVTFFYQIDKKISDLKQIIKK